MGLGWLDIAAYFSDPWQQVDPVAGLMANLWRLPLHLKAEDGANLSPAKLARAFASSPFGGAREHGGIDYPVPVGTPVYSPIKGTVIKAGQDSSGRGGLGVIIEAVIGVWGHQGGLWHLSRVDVREGATVEGGQLIGLSGATGDPPVPPHLHHQQRIRFPVGDWAIMTFGDLDGQAVPIWPVINAYFAQLSESRPADLTLQAQWGAWLETGNHAAAQKWLKAQNPPEPWAVDEVVRDTSQAVSDAVDAVKDAAEDAADKLKSDVPWAWIGGGLAFLAAAGVITYAYAKGAR